jgi:thiol-disulfide isomerase/thioredoxin
MRSARVRVAPASLVAALAAVVLAANAVTAAEQADKERVRPALAVGSDPHDELGKDMNGEKIRLSDYRGKVVIVSFWASWCEPCKKELPVLAGVARRVGPEHMKIIAINFHDDNERFRAVVKILKEYPITMLRDASGRAARSYDVRAIPRMIVIGRDGKVASDRTGYGEGSLPGFIDELNRLLAQTT